MLDSRTHIDKANLYRNKLLISGWSFVPNEQICLDKIKVTCQNYEFKLIKLDKYLFSQDVAISSGCNHANNCRFELQIEITPIEYDFLLSSMIQIIPIFDNQSGNFVHTWALPIPDEQTQNIVGGSDWEKISTGWKNLLIELGGLHPTHNVLDIGCGCGRVAYPLVYYLTPMAVYEGFDVVDKLVQWCQQTITPRFSNFKFCKANVANLHYDKYNENNENNTTEFIFPYENEKFDFVVLTSVFTHMRSQDIAHYLKEMYRVLKPGGRCFVTFFLLTLESKLLIATGKSMFNIVHPIGNAFTSQPNCPEECLGYEESFIKKLVNDKGFQVTGTHYGKWCGRERFFDTQDILILTKQKA